jgi:hypothetical protein
MITFQGLEILSPENSCGLRQGADDLFALLDEAVPDFGHGLLGQVDRQWIAARFTLPGRDIRIAPLDSVGENKGKHGAHLLGLDLNTT